MTAPGDGLRKISRQAQAAHRHAERMKRYHEARGTNPFRESQRRGWSPDQLAALEKWARNAQEPREQP